MPLAFDRQAAAGVRATIQFRVSGAEAGDYWLRIDRGRCRSAAGTAEAPDLVIHTPDRVWLRIARGELDGSRALMDGLYRAEGDIVLLAKLQSWFPRAS
jgi:putative sterol carrier protein